MRCPLFVATLALAVSPVSLSGQNPLPSGSRLTRAQDLGLLAPNGVPETIRYGGKPWQDIELYRAKNESAAPLVIAFSADGVSEWPRYRFNQAGMSLAVVPNKQPVRTAQKTIANYIAAIAQLYREAQSFGIDRSRIVLYGSGNGGSMAVLFGTDPALLARAGVPFDALRGIVSIGGEDFDVARRASESAYLRSLYRRYYGAEKADLTELSPVTHLAPPNAPAFLLLASERDENGVRESRLMAQALVQPGTTAAFVRLPEKRQGRRPTYLLAEPSGSGWEIIAFLQSALDIGR
jgi:hypothetical protein